MKDNLKFDNAMNGCHAMMGAMRTYLMDVMSEERAYEALRFMMMEAFGSEALKAETLTQELYDECSDGFLLEYMEYKAYGKTEG